MENKAIDVVDALLDDLEGRQGFDEFWGSIDRITQNHIRAELYGKAEAILNG